MYPAAANLSCSSLLSMAQSTKTRHYVRPRLQDSAHLKIINGRHPIQEMLLPTFVDNSTLFDNEHSKIVVLSGANLSGKSVYLKQVVLIVFLAQIGCFVPADECCIGLVDKIFTRIQTRDTISQVCRLCFDRSPVQG